MQCINFPGQSLMTRDFDRQILDLQARTVVRTDYTALGTPLHRARGTTAPG